MDYSNHYMYGGRKRGFFAANWRVLLAVTVVVIGSLAGVSYYEFKTHPQWGEIIADYHARTTTWLAERKKNLHHGIARVKREVIENDDSEREVKFEFYNTLQDMKSMQVDVQAETKMKAQESDPVKPAQKSAAKRTRNEPQTKISRSADIENDLLAAMQQNNRRN
jgi:hypothetical protein